VLASVEGDAGKGRLAAERAKGGVARRRRSHDDVTEGWR
jgi:hypothetical protein